MIYQAWEPYWKRMYQLFTMTISRGGQISRFVPIVGFVELAAPAPVLLYQLDSWEEYWTSYY